MQALLARRPGPRRFSLLDGEWAATRRAFARWLDPSDLDEDGRRRATLEALRAPGAPSPV